MHTFIYAWVRQYSYTFGLYEYSAIYRNLFVHSGEHITCVHCSF